MEVAIRQYDATAAAFALDPSLLDPGAPPVDWRRRFVPTVPTRAEWRGLSPIIANSPIGDRYFGQEFRMRGV